MKRTPRTLLEHCLARGGVLRGGRVAGVVAQWAIATHSVGHELTLQEYRDWWREGERTAYRDQAAFRKLFPEFSTPAPLAHALIESYMARQAEGHDDKLRGGIPALIGQPIPVALVH